MIRGDMSLNRVVSRKEHGVGGDDGRTVRDMPSTGLWAALVFLVALNLRPAIAAVGPLLSELGADLGWGEGVQGILAAMPLWAFAAVSPLVGFVTARIGTDATVAVALALLAFGDLARSACGRTGVWVGTVVVGSAIAIGNVLVPVIAKRDFRERVSVATGVYSGCITAGSAIAGATAVPLADLLGGWRPSLAFWAIPPLIVLALWLARLWHTSRPDAVGADCDGTGGTDGVVTAGTGASDATGTSDVPDVRNPSGGTDSRVPRDDAAGGVPMPLWRRPMTWWVTLYMGLQSAAFYTMSNWLPSVSAGAGFDAGMAGMHLFLFQFLGIFSGLLIPMLMQVGGNQVCAALVSSLPMVVAYVGMLTLPQVMMVWSVIGGCGQGATLVVALSLIALRGGTAQETVRLSGIAQSLGYLLASIGPAAFGMLAEFSGAWSTPLLLALTLAAAQCVVAVLVGRPCP